MKIRHSVAVLFLLSTVGVPFVDADEGAVRKTLTEYVDVFNQKTAEKIAGFWTENGTHTDRQTGQRTAGREAIQADVMKLMKEGSDFKLSATITGIRLITADVASVEGETTVVISDADPLVSKYTAILVRQGDKWLLDTVEEMPLPQPASTADALKELEWLVGEWVDDSGAEKVTMTFRWTANQAFLLRSFSVENKEDVTMTGTQVIGWDPRGQQIRSWSFTSDGAFGESTWLRDENRWMSKSSQTLVSGEVASGTYVMERLDDDSFTMQLVGYEVGGQPQPTGSSVKVIRAPQQPATDSTPEN